MTELDVKLQRNADELLKDFPVTEPDFEAQARAIEARLGAPLAKAALSNDELLGPPSLAEEEREPSLPSQVRAAPKSNFAEMARRSLPKSDEGAAALAKELFAATAHRRKPDAQLVERVRAAGKNAVTTPLPSSEPRRERHSGVVARDAGAAASPPAARKPERDKRGLLIALTGIGVAAAAAFTLFANGPAPSTPTTADAPRPVAAKSEPAAATPAPAPSPRQEQSVTPDALPPAVTMAEAKPAERAREAKTSGALPAAKPVAGSARASSAPERVELPDEPRQLAAAESPVQPPAAAPEPALRPAEGHTGSVPLSPSSGAVSTALGAVRSAAQACLAGQTEPVTASVTFASGGQVLRVSAGGPSGGCIQAALSKARIAPFAKDSFSATATIRPP